MFDDDYVIKSSFKTSIKFLYSLLRPISLYLLYFGMKAPIIYLLPLSESSSRVRVKGLSVLSQMASSFNRATITEQLVSTIDKVNDSYRLKRTPFLMDYLTVGKINKYLQFT